MIASEDAGFADHGGVEWDAIEKAWERNQRAEARAEQPRRSAQAPAPTAAARPRSSAARRSPSSWPRTCSCRGERTVAAQGPGTGADAACSKALLRKQRILEIYLNNVEWGEGVFGAQAAARHYFRIDAAQLGADAGGAAGGDAAGAQALREAARLGLRRRPRRDGRRAHGRRGAALSRDRATTPHASDPMSADEIAAAAARLVVEEGMEYGAGQAQGGARRSARARAVELPSNERSRTRCASTSRCSAPTPSRPNCARCASVALRWMERLAEFRPHLTGAVWRGTATRHVGGAPRPVLRRPEGGRDRADQPGVDYDVGASTAGRAANRWTC